MREALTRLATAALLGAADGAHALDPAIRPLETGAAAAGPARTCRCPAGDNLAVVRALDSCRAGDVLVVETDPAVETAIVGGLLGAFAAERGLSAIVTNGWARDSAELRILGFPVWCRGVRLQGPAREQPGELGVPVRLGTGTVEPDDLVRADDDGVVVVPRALARTVLDRAATKEEAEAAMLGRIREGTALADALRRPGRSFDRPDDHLRDIKRRPGE